MEVSATLALVGNPNSGKSALFNALTGARQKVANYPGVTVERRVGHLPVQAGGKSIEVIDLPGSYSLTPRSPDEEVARDVIEGRMPDHPVPDGILCVIDATNLRQHLRFVLELKRIGQPLFVALNMMDLARRDGIEIDLEVLRAELGVPVIETVAVRRHGIDDLVVMLTDELADLAQTSAPAANGNEAKDVRALQREASRIAKLAIVTEGVGHRLTRTLDNVLLNKIAGPLILFALLFTLFQAVFAWAETPMAMIDDGIIGLQNWVIANLPATVLRSLLVDGILAGVGSVIIFMPQILILFAFIILLEASGYMARAAFIMDRLMSVVGLNGRAFIPLLSSFACAIPGIMAARTIANPRDRLTTILIAPLMTCSARIPVYAIIIAAFIPNRSVGMGIGLQGLVLFSLYMAGILSALIIAFVLKRTVMKGPSQALIMELPKYQAPRLRDMLLGLYERARIFLKRAGTIILSAMVILWVLASFPSPPEGATDAAIYYSFAGMIGQGLQVFFAPLGFNWEISIALVPGMAAREVAVAALGTVYSLSGSEDAIATSLASTLQQAWSLPTALSFLAWYVYAPQCIATLAITKRETNGWTWPMFMAGYMFALAYLVSFITYQVSSALLI